MKPIMSELELEEELSRPYEEDVAAAKRLNGDLLLLGVGGKMGPSLAHRAKRAIDLAGVPHRVIAVARFTDPGLPDQLASWGVETIAADLLEPGSLDKLPDAPNVIYMAARKFGTTGMEHLTWASNAYLPGLVAERFRRSRIVAFSTGNVYPLLPTYCGGATEAMAPAPVGEYGQSALARERMFEYGCHRYGTPVTLLRLNYAIDLRYGVLTDIGRKVFERHPIDLRMGLVNVIWQGDANSICLRSLEHCQCPPLVINLTGPETLSVKWIAEEFGRRLGVAPHFENEETGLALLSNSARSISMFGYPKVSVLQMIDWITAWIGRGGVLWDKPTHFQTQDGKF